MTTYQDPVDIDADADGRLFAASSVCRSPIPSSPGAARAKLTR
jgi:hypothetical protein